MDANISITILELPNGRVGFQVNGGMIFAALAAAERYAANLAAKLARVAKRAVEAVKATVKASKPAVAVRLRKLARKAGVLADRAKRRSYHAVLNSNHTYFIATDATRREAEMVNRLCRLSHAAVDRERRLYAALDTHVAARLSRTV